MGDINDYAKQLKDIEKKTNGASDSTPTFDNTGDTKDADLKQMETPFEEPKAKPAVVKNAKGEVVTVPTAKTTTKPKTPSRPKITDPRDEIVLALEKFALATGHMAVIEDVRAGEKITKKYARPEAWKYLAELCDTYTAVIDTHYCGWKNDPASFRVEATCELRRKKDDFVLTCVTACAASDEKFIQVNGVSAAYGLATTRAEERAVRSVFGQYMAAVGLCITPYSEIEHKMIDLEMA